MGAPGPRRPRADHRGGTVLWRTHDRAASNSERSCGRLNSGQVASPVRGPCFLRRNACRRRRTVPGARTSHPPDPIRLAPARSESRLGAVGRGSRSALNSVRRLVALLVWL
jgi:hypothetical protein